MRQALKKTTSIFSAGVISGVGRELGRSIYLSIKDNVSKGFSTAEEKDFAIKRDELKIKA